MCHSTTLVLRIYHSEEDFVDQTNQSQKKAHWKKESNQCHHEVQKEAEINADNVVLLVRERNLKWQLLERIKLNLCPVYII